MAQPISSPGAGGMPHLLSFTNCQTCVSGELIPQDVYFSPDQGIIVPNYYYRTEGVERIDLGGAVVAPGFLELQTNGLQGLHFTQLGQKDDEEKLLQVARSQVRCGVTAFWCTIPTVEEASWKKVSLTFLNHSARGLRLLCTSMAGKIAEEKQSRFDVMMKGALAFLDYASLQVVLRRPGFAICRASPSGDLRVLQRPCVSILQFSSGIFQPSLTSYTPSMEPHVAQRCTTSNHLLI